MSDEKFELTRRKLLAGVGSVGLASAGAGLGTSALFSDTESFEENSITAGTLDLQVSADIQGYSAPIVAENTSFSPSDVADGAAMGIVVEDCKPGDWLIIAWNAQVATNPGYLQITSVDDDYENDEGETPEAATQTSPPGNLGEALLSTLWHSIQPVETDRQYLQHLDTSTDKENTELPSYENPENLDGETNSGAHYTTMNEMHGVYQDGVVLENSSGDPMEIGWGPNSATFYQLLHLPLGVGNEVQGDSLTFTLQFDTQQVRNNEDPFNNS
nr:SipW-dependent-type signal peptide-containing protein [Halobellus captivus]